MTIEEQYKEEFVRKTGMQPEDDWGAYFSFVNLKITIYIRDTLIEKRGKDTNRGSIFDD